MNINKLITLALAEDIGTGDITTEYLELAKKNTSAYLVAKQDGILCGLNVSFSVFHSRQKNQ